MSATWSEIQSAYAELVRAGHRSDGVAGAWQCYAERVRSTESAPPYHLGTLLDILHGMKKQPAEIQILEHGCGGGSTLLYLLALGYTGIHGVDLGLPVATLDRITAAAGLSPRFTIYDGRRLPHPDASFDLVFSQQVLEHVDPDVIDAYYAEEARVLVTGGIAYHQVPHRLVPYESHTRTWLIHYLPWSLARRMYRMLGRDSAVVREHLFLRWPGFHRRQSRRWFGHCRDMTGERLRKLRVGEYYDGPARLRRAVARVAAAPILGKAFAALMGNFVMLDTISVNRGARGDTRAAG